MTSDAISAYRLAQQVCSPSFDKLFITTVCLSKASQTRSLPPRRCNVLRASSTSSPEGSGDFPCLRRVVGLCYIPCSVHCNASPQCPVARLFSYQRVCRYHGGEAQNGPGQSQSSRRFCLFGTFRRRR